MKKAIILDRDGTLIEDKNYAYKIEDLELLPGVIEGLTCLKEEFVFFIVTNQSGIGRGYYSIAEFQNFNNHLLDILRENNIEILKTYFCPHLKEETCECRKPNIKFIDEIITEFEIDINNSWMMGDHPSDIEFGINGGCKTVFLTTGHGDRHLDELKLLGLDPTLISDNFLKAAREIISFL
jgi:D-glycero-D-manno-heptose 1,7-bisphosphate phosphatase